MSAEAQAHSAGFQNVEETDELRRVPSGRLAVWWFLASEIMVFGGLIGCFLLVQAAHGGFGEAASHVKWKLGAFNTLVLVTSSLTMILAHSAASAHNSAKTRACLLATVLLGLLFLGVKSLEYTSEIREGFTPSAGTFWSFYFIMTGLHGLHLIGGIIVNTILFIAALRRQPWEILERRVEFAGLYWHFVDVVWIFLFPLIYLT
ncbi:MAG TPA: cytochrome c oxidase subunit 3 [Terriglobales bacterium]|nr:cytochrome c oxidase subunit 3 [Terriglobales bacterium]